MRINNKNYNHSCISIITRGLKKKKKFRKDFRENNRFPVGSSSIENIKGQYLFKYTGVKLVRRIGSLMNAERDSAQKYADKLRPII